MLPLFSLAVAITAGIMCAIMLVILVGMMLLPAMHCKSLLLCGYGSCVMCELNLLLHVFHVLHICDCYVVCLCVRMSRCV